MNCRSRAIVTLVLTLGMPVSTASSQEVDFRQRALASADSATEALSSFAAGSTPERLVAAIRYASQSVVLFELTVDAADSDIATVKDIMQQLSGGLGQQLIEILAQHGRIPFKDQPGLVTFAAIARNRVVRLEAVH